MIGMFEVPMAVVRADMLGDRLVLVMEGNSIRIDFGREGRAGPMRRDRVTVGLPEYAETAINGQRAHQGGVVGQGREGLELGFFFREQFQWRLVRLAVKASVGDGFQPMASGGIESWPRRQFQTAQEVLLNEFDTILNAPFFVPLSYA